MLAKLITEGSEASANQMEFPADDYDQEHEILAIKQELSSHTHPSLASPEGSPGSSASDACPSINKSSGYSNNQSTTLPPAHGDTEKQNQERGF